MPIFSGQKTILRYLSIVFVFLCGIAGAVVFVIIGLGSKIDTVSIVGNVLGAVGNQLSAVSTPYGKIDLKTKRRSGGLDVRIICADCRLRSHRLATQTLRLDQASLEGFYKDRHFRGKVQIDKILAYLDTSWSNDKASGSFTLPESSIADIFSALASIVPEAQNATITGTIAGTGKFAWPEIDLLFDPKIQNFTVDGLVSKEDYSKGTFTFNGRDQGGGLITITTGEGSEDFTPLAMLGPYLPAAAVAAEDGAFYSHPGYDVQSMIEATRRNRQAKEIRRGGSTITQQLAKNLFLSGERTYSRKLRELLYAVELDRELGKKRVLELYLNVVEWGPGIYGARQAAKIFFGKVPIELLPEEAAWLAGILNSPGRAWERQYKQNRPNLSRVTLVLKRMKGLSERDLQAALSRPIRFAGAAVAEQSLPSEPDEDEDE